MSVDVREVMNRLAEPFDPKEVKFKPAVVSGNRAMALCYIDARVVQDRLDEVVGPENWQDSYKILAEGSVICRLRVRIGGEWISKCDVGSESEQKDHGDRTKAAFSDALKRAAVKFGIGRYLYRLPSQWVDYDPQKKHFIKEPQLPSWALPKNQAKPALQPVQQTQPSGVGITMVHQRLKDRNLTWRKALQHVCGISMGEDFGEPETAPQAVMVLAPLLTPDQVDKLLRNVQPKEKSK